MASKKPISANNINVTGDFIAGDQYNYYYSGDFASLSEYYISPDSVFQRVRTDDFIGRDWLTTKVDAFLNDPNRKSGAFLLIGDAGVGKTSFMAHLVKERRYLHLFAEQAPGQAMLQRAMQSLGSQLVTRYQIDPYKDRDTLNALSVFPDFLERILRLAANTLTEGEKIVIVCDALDEAGTFPDHFVFGLPKELPDGVYFILSQRPVNVKLPNFEPEIENIEAQGKDNLQDMESYLLAVAKRPAIAGQIQTKQYSEEFFIQTLKEKSQGVWMYLYYVIKEIELGQRAPLELENLPKGLVGYYSEYWDNWRSGYKGIDSSKWDTLYGPLLSTLAAAQQAIPLEKLIEWSEVRASSSDVARLLNESWSAFVAEKHEEDKIVYTLYHQSLRDFIIGKVEIKKLPPTHANLVSDLAKKKVEADKRIVSAFEKECNGEWEKLVEQDYPRLHLTAHLNGAGEYEKLQILLTEGEEKIKWAEAREQKEETYVNYLRDLDYVWRYAEQENNYVLLVRCMLIKNSVHSIASNIPPELLAQLAKIGLWSYSRCLSSIREGSNSRTQEKALKLIAPDLPLSLLSEALFVIGEIDFEPARTRTLAAFAPYLVGELKLQAFSMAREIKDETARARALSALAPYLDKEQKVQALVDGYESAQKINDEFDRALTLADLIPQLNEEIKPRALLEGLEAMREVKDEQTRTIALAEIVPHLNNELKTQALKEGLETARGIKDEAARANALSFIASYLNDEQKLQALTAAYDIKDERWRVMALASLVPHLNNKLKANTLIEGFETAHQIKDEVSRVRALVSLAPHLSNELKENSLAEDFKLALEINDEYYRSEALSDLVPYLDDKLKLQAFAVAREIKDKVIRTRALASLIPYLKDLALKTQALEEGLEAAREIKDESEYANALVALGPYLSEKIKADVVVNVRKIKDETIRTKFLATFSLHQNDLTLKTQLLEEGLAVLRIIKLADLHQTLSALAPHLNKEQRLRAFTIVCEIESEYDRAGALSVLAPYLENELIAQAITIAREIEDLSLRAGVLVALSPYMNKELKTQMLAKELAAIRESKDEYYRANALANLAPYLNNELKKQVLKEGLVAARKIKTEYPHIRIGALANLASHLDNKLKEKTLDKVFAMLSEIKNERYYVNTLSILAVHLGKNLTAQALVVAREIKDDSSRAEALAVLAPYLNKEIRAQVVGEGVITASRIKDGYSRASVLSDLAFQLNGEAQIKVLSELLYINDKDSFPIKLEKIFALWQKIDFIGFQQNVVPFIKFTAQKNRKDGIDTISLITPALVHFRGPEIADELYRTITDVTRWWP